MNQLIFIHLWHLYKSGLIQKWTILILKGDIINYLLIEVSLHYIVFKVT